MKKLSGHILTAFTAFLIVCILNFLLPRFLPGDPVSYLTGYDEAAMSSEKYDYYYNALHLNENIISQFRFYLSSLFDGSFGFSYKKNSTVASLIAERLPASLQITVPAALISILLGLVWGLSAAYKKDSAFDRFSTAGMLIVNGFPSFIIALLLMILFCFKIKLFPYTGLSSGYYDPGTAAFFADRLWHLILPVLVLVLSTLPARYLLVRNTAASFAKHKSVIYAEQRGLAPSLIKYSYILKNISGPFITMTGMVLAGCMSGSLIVENIFSINGVGGLLTEAVYTLDYPLMQGLFFVISAYSLLCIIVSDVLCLVFDPELRHAVLRDRSFI